MKQGVRRTFPKGRRVQSGAGLLEPRFFFVSPATGKFRLQLKKRGGGTNCHDGGTCKGGRSPPAPTTNMKPNVAILKLLNAFEHIHQDLKIMHCVYKVVFSQWISGSRIIR